MKNVILVALGLAVAISSAHWYRVEGQYTSAKQVVKDLLIDPYSAQFKDVRHGKDYAICGQVNAKNRMGAYIGYNDFYVIDGKATIVPDKPSIYADSDEKVYYGVTSLTYLVTCALN